MLLIPIQTCLYLFHIFFSEIPVEIIRPPQDILEAPGADVVFLAELNKDKVEVQWLKNNMIIKPQGDKHQMMSEGKIHEATDLSTSSPVTRVNTDLLPKTKKPELSLNWQVSPFLLSSDTLTILQILCWFQTS